MLDSKSADANLKLIDFGASVKTHPGEILRRKIGSVYNENDYMLAILYGTRSFKVSLRQKM